MTHFAEADDPDSRQTPAQIDAFSRISGEFSGVLATVNSLALNREITQAQVQIQEDLFAQMREELAGPAAFLPAFLAAEKIFLASNFSLI